MKVDFLYFEDCPSHDTALDRLRTLLAEEGVDAEICIHKVETDEQAQSLRFPGSPTIRINDQDIDPEGAAALPYALTCRAYRRPEDGRITPLPSEALIRAALNKETQHG